MIVVAYASGIAFTRSSTVCEWLDVGPSKYMYVLIRPLLVRFGARSTCSYIFGHRLAWSALTALLTLETGVSATLPQFN